MAQINEYSIFYALDCPSEIGWSKIEIDRPKLPLNMAIVSVPTP
jgi:hypothetical protein